MRKNDGTDGDDREEESSGRPYDALEPRLEIRQPERTDEFTIPTAPRRHICKAPPPKLGRGRRSR